MTKRFNCRESIKPIEFCSNLLMSNNWFYKSGHGPCTIPPVHAHCAHFVWFCTSVHKL